MGSGWEPDTKIDWPIDRQSKLDFNFSAQYMLPHRSASRWQHMLIHEQLLCDCNTADNICIVYCKS
jgi:hypothetical protein